MGMVCYGERGFCRRRGASRVISTCVEIATASAGCGLEAGYRVRARGAGSPDCAGARSVSIAMVMFGEIWSRGDVRTVPPTLRVSTEVVGNGERASEFGGALEAFEWRLY